MNADKRVRRSGVNFKKLVVKFLRNSLQMRVRVYELIERYFDGPKRRRCQQLIHEITLKYRLANVV